MKKELVISAKLDTQDLDRSFKSLRERLQNITLPSQTQEQFLGVRQRAAAMGLARPLTEQEQRQMDLKARESMRETEKFIKEQFKHHDEINKAISRRREELERLNRIYKEGLEIGKEDLKLKERIANQQKAIGRLEAVQRDREAALEEATEILENRKREELERIRQARIDRMSRIGGIATGVGTALSFATNALNFYNQMPLEMARGQAAAASGMAAPMLQAAAAGQLSSYMFYAPERLRAIQEAIRASELMQKTALARLAAGVSTGLGVGIKSAVGGSIIPGLGTLGGAAIGVGAGLAASGGFSGVAEGLGAMGVPGFRDYFKARQAEFLMQRFQQMEAAEKAKSPLRKAAEEYFTQFAERDLQFQRMLGIRGAEFRGPGGLISRAAEAGFRIQDVMGAAGGIMQAGGSTRVARESAITANLLQRNFDLINAPQVLGLIGSRMGSGSLAEQATIKILAEGTRLGLDKSEFAEEQRQFVQSVAQIGAAAGVRTDEGFRDIARSLSAFITDRTTGGIQDAVTAYKRFEQLTGEEGGVARQAFRVAEMARQSPKLRGLTGGMEGRAILQTIADMPMSEFHEANPVVQAAMLHSGVSFEELKRSKMLAAASSIDITGVIERSQAFKNIKEAYEKSPESLPELLRSAEGGTLISLASQLGISGRMNATQTASLLAGMFGVTDETQVRDIQSTIERLRKGATETGRVEDIKIAGDAAGLRAITETIDTMEQDFARAGQAAAQLSTKMFDLVTQLERAIKEKDLDRAREINQQMIESQSQASSARRAGASGSWE